MKAEQMFKEIEWKKIKDNDSVIAYYHDRYSETIEFSKEYKEYYVYNLAIDMVILKAIIQQCRELGWLDD